MIKLLKYVLNGDGWVTIVFYLLISAFCFVLFLERMSSLYSTIYEAVNQCHVQESAQ